MKLNKSGLTKSKKYAISGLSINKDTTSYVILPNIEGQKALSDILGTYSVEKNKFNIGLRILKRREL